MSHQHSLVPQKPKDEQDRHDDPCKVKQNIAEGPLPARDKNLMILIGNAHNGTDQAGEEETNPDGSKVDLVCLVDSVLKVETAPWVSFFGLVAVKTKELWGKKRQGE